MPSRSDSSHSSSSDSQEFYQIYQKQLAKQQRIDSQRKEQFGDQIRRDQIQQIQKNEPRKDRSRSRSNERGKHLPIELKWHIYQAVPEMNLIERIPSNIWSLPIFRKRKEILSKLIHNQVILVTGDTGCGKSTQVPRLCYEYLRELGREDKIMCVQPRRLAVLNLHTILDKQMVEKDRVGYQIGMQTHINPGAKIVFMTNGIFLQRLVHSPQFLKEYTFLVLDEVHQRDIDTDFILLAVKRILRSYPRLRVILMSATIDNQLFRYYFAEDHIDSFLEQKNFYKQVLDRELVDSDDERNAYKMQELAFMRSKRPCPTVNVTEAGKYTRQYFYLNTMKNFISTTSCLQWGSIQFCDKYPSMHKELFEVVCCILNEIVHKKHLSVILIFLPGLAEIENLGEAVQSYFGRETIAALFEVLHVHSTILTQDITHKLHMPPSHKHRLILATNIAESSITVMGVNYVIDFCLCKEVKFDLKSRMENLCLVWASQASCSQRAGRTGRVCNGTIFRLVEDSFYSKLAAYSTPEIQRSSLDKVVLRIKLVHQNQAGNTFQDPGNVLGSAIQPPHLRNIDSAITSLLFYGGLERRLRPESTQEEDFSFELTKLGRLYVDMPIDITYCKALIASMLFGVYEDMLILVAILSQNKNAYRRNLVDRAIMDYFQLIDSPYSCDFYGLVRAYREREQRKGVGSHKRLELDVYHEARQLAADLDRRIKQKYGGTLRSDNWSHQSSSKYFKTKTDERFFRFQMALVCGFVDKLLKVREPILDDKQEKRANYMKRNAIPVCNTLCLMTSNVLKKLDGQAAEQRLIRVWNDHFEKTMKIKDVSFTLCHGMSYIHFKNQRDLNKFLLVKHSNDSRALIGEERTHASVMSVNELLKCVGEVDFMQRGRPMTFQKQQTVQVDNYSINRVVPMYELDPPKLLVSHNISQQSSRLSVRFTSLLPALPYMETLTHLLFYPFVSLEFNQQVTSYSALRLRRKVVSNISYELTGNEVQQANSIRKQLRQFFEIDPSAYFPRFCCDVLDFLHLPRKEVKREEKWQAIYLGQVVSRKRKVPEPLFQIALSVNKDRKKDLPPVSEERTFMNQIAGTQLNSDFFLSSEIMGWRRQKRVEDYEKWKHEKLRQIESIQDRVTNHETYLVCGQPNCCLRVSQLKKVGPIIRQSYREIFQLEEGNIMQLPFNEMDSYFCSMVLIHGMEHQFSVYGCTNKHHFGIKLKGEPRMKIMQFSQLIVIYPDGNPSKYDFERLDLKYWKKNADDAVSRKLRLPVSTHCFVCDQNFTSMKELDAHLKDQLHTANLREFKMSWLGASLGKKEEEGY